MKGFTPDGGRAIVLIERKKPLTEKEPQVAKQDAKNDAKGDSKSDSKSAEVKDRKPRIDKSLKIKILAEKNPKREGSATFDRFEYYKNGQTVEQALEKGVQMQDIRYDVEHKFIQLTG